MDVLEELYDLAARVAKVIEGAGGPWRDTRIARRLTDAVLAILDRYDLDELAALAEAGDLDRIVAAAIAETFETASAELARDVASRSSTAIRDAAAFYAARGIDPVPVSEAVRRSEIATRLSGAFQEGMKQIGTDIYQATRDVTLEAVASGTVDRQAIQDEIVQRTGVTRVKAATQAQLAVGAYAEAWNEELGHQAGLDHLHYAGTLKANSRHFCRAHLDRVFTIAQVELMDNGQGLSPVRIYRGGYRCRHRLAPVDPEWSESLRTRVVPEGTPATRVQLDRAGNRFITVVVPTAEVARLERQILLSRKRDGEPVYTVFENAPDNPSGFRAFHNDWLLTRLGFKPGQPRRADMDAESAAAEGLAANGHEALLPPPSVTNPVSGDVDLIWNGRPTEVKTPTALDAGSLSRPLKAHQADLHLISLTGPLTDEANARERLADWLDRHPGNDVWILHRYADNRLEGPIR